MSQSDQGLRCPLTESLNTTECMNRERRPGWDYAQAQDELNLRSLSIYEGTFSLDAVHFNPFTVGEDGPNPTIAAGIYQYRFSFQLPADRLPSSYEGSYGAIRYWLQLQIDRPLLKFDTDRHKMITVLDRIDVNIPEFSVSRLSSLTL